MKLYEQGMYGASSRIAEEILRNRPDYLEVMKILGFSYYELGKYADAKKYLLTYLEKNPKDLESTLRMGEIFAHAGDFASANLYLNNAILAGYTPKTDLERRLAYNYSLLGDSAGLMKVMNYLLQETDVKEDDYAVAISLAISQGDLARGRTWSLDGIKKFQNSVMLTPLYIETLRLLGERDTATMLIENTDSHLLEANPNFLLQKGILLFEQGRYDDAEIIFEKLSGYDEWPGVTEEANTYITSIKNLRSQSGSSFFH